jgi:phospholipid N-methyltransferase
MAMEGFIARWYAKNTKGNLDQYKNYAKRVAENVTEGSNILEVAPGPGYLSIELMKMGDYNVTGLDISKTFVQIANNNAKEEGVKVNFTEGDASNMPFDNETFDFLVCTAAFKNFTKPIIKPTSNSSCVAIAPFIPFSCLTLNKMNLTNNPLVVKRVIYPKRTISTLIYITFTIRGSLLFHMI